MSNDIKLWISRGGMTLALLLNLFFLSRTLGAATQMWGGNMTAAQVYLVPWAVAFFLSVLLVDIPVAMVYYSRKATRWNDDEDQKRETAKVAIETLANHAKHQQEAGEVHAWNWRDPFK